MNLIEFKPIGVIHSPYKNPSGVPRQAAGASDVAAEIEIFDEYIDGLTDLEGFSHIVVIFHLHLVTEPSLKAHPPWDNKEHGVFATRSPHRPNPIGVSVVRLEEIDGNILKISRVDMVDGTPVLDIKPYIPRLNPTEDVRIGWLESIVDGMNKGKPSDR